jgi:hypothetical protein
MPTAASPASIIGEIPIREKVWYASQQISSILFR